MLTFQNNLRAPLRMFLTKAALCVESKLEYGEYNNKMDEITEYQKRKAP